MVTDAAAEGAVAAAALLGVEGDGLAAVGGEGEIGGHVDREPRPVDALVGDPFENVLPPDLQVEIIEGVGILQVAVEQFPGGLIRIIAAVGQIGPPPAVQVEAQPLLFEGAGIDLQVLVARRGLVVVALKQTKQGVGGEREAWRSSQKGADIAEVPVRAGLRQRERRACGAFFSSGPPYSVHITVCGWINMIKIQYLNPLRQHEN